MSEEIKKVFGLPEDFVREYLDRDKIDPEFYDEISMLAEAIDKSGCVLYHRSEVPRRVPQSVLDDFAGRAMQSMIAPTLAMRDLHEHKLPYNWGEIVGPDLARHAFAIARAMMEEREETRNG